jgi:hypothetical protein
MMIKPISLKLGKTYYYFNKSTYESTKGSWKECRLISLSSDKKFARVRRVDLDVNPVQSIYSSRLRELARNIDVNGQMRLEYEEK